FRSSRPSSRKATATDLTAPPARPTPRLPPDGGGRIPSSRSNAMTSTRNAPRTSRPDRFQPGAWIYARNPDGCGRFVCARPLRKQLKRYHPVSVEGLKHHPARLRPTNRIEVEYMLARTDVIVVGAGPAGLATSRSLSLRGIEHVVLERGEVGERWHSERWPGLTLLTPNWMNGLPGFTPDGAVDGFMPAAAFAAFLDRYRAEIVAPVVTGCAVHSVTASGSGFRVRASRGAWECRAVVVATGACDRATVPAWSGDLPGRLHQITPGRYRGSGDLPAGRVLVVGASATGVQIASDLRAAGREVVLSVGRHVRAPRRYRGRDLFHWLH